MQNLSSLIASEIRKVHLLVVLLESLLKKCMQNYIVLEISPS